MNELRFGRKKYSVEKGKPVLKSTSITVRALPGEDEESFTSRLIRKYGQQAGTVEMVFKHGRPDYAVITITEQGFTVDSISNAEDKEA